MRVFLTTLGCRLNEAEIGELSRAFCTAGHVVVETAEEAQLLVVNTCAVTGEASRKSRKLIASLHRRNPAARLAVTGCYAELEAERAAELAGVDLVLDNRDKDHLVEIVADRLDPESLPEPLLAPDSSAPSEEHRRRTRAFVKVQDGCRNRCSYCVVTLARGEERSRPIAEAVKSVSALCDAGYKEVVLTGVHLGGYGRDHGTNLASLVDALLADTPVPRLRLSSLEPWDLPERFWDLWQSPRLMPHVHLPLQSGCDSVLARMSRRCTTESFRTLVAEARAAIPGLTVTTDVIVGFPGETEAEFEATLDFVRELAFGHVHIFAFSPRQGTRAAMLPNRVATDTTRARSRRLHEVAAGLRTAHALGFLGQTRPVLWESGTVDEPGSRTRWLGYTDNYLRVVSVPLQRTPLENRITPARLERVSPRPAALLEARPLMAHGLD